MIVRVFKIKFNVMQNFLCILSCFIFCVVLSSLLKKIYIPIAYTCIQILSFLRHLRSHSTSCKKLNRIEEVICD